MNPCWKCQGNGYYTKSNRPHVKLSCKLCVKTRTTSTKSCPPRHDFHILIVGAGLGGSALALALGRLGFKVTVLESDGSFDERKQGYGLTIQQGFAAMRYLGIEIPKDTPSYSHFAFNEKGKILGYFGAAFSQFFELGGDFSKKQNGSFNGKGKYNVHIPRQHLRYLLLNAVSKEGLENIRIHWGTTVTQFERDGDLVHVDTAKGCRYSANLLVGADGIYSCIRAKLLKDPLAYLGCVVVLGIAPFSHPLTHERVCESMDGSTRVYSMPFTSKNGVDIHTDPVLKGKDSTMWQLSFPVTSVEEAKRICASRESLKLESLRRCSHFHAPIPDLIRETSPTLLSGHPVYDRALFKPEVFQNSLDEHNLSGFVLLIGDSCHPMSPFKGQGANQALIDASNFAKQLASMESFDNRADIEKVVGLFLDEMSTRSARKVLGSRKAAQVLHTPFAKDDQAIEQSNLEEAGISALTPENLNESVINLCGYGHKPHTLHREKIKESRRHETGNV